MAVSPTLREEFKTTLKVSAYTTLCAGSIKASKNLVGTLSKSAKSATKGKFSLQKTFTNAEMKELLASKANDNVFLVNDNGIYMSKGKVVNGESVGVGRVSSNVSGSSRVGVRSKSYNVRSRNVNGKGVAEDVVEAVKDVERKIGQSGKYKDLTKPGRFNDDMQAHHMPAQKYLRENDLSTRDGFSAIIPQELHKQTRTFGSGGRNMDTTAPYRSEIGKDLKEYVRILKDNNSWTPEVRQSLMKGLDDFKKEFPDLFKRVIK